MTYTKIEIREILLSGESKSDICRKLGMSVNGNNIRKVSKLLLDNDIEVVYNQSKKQTRYKTVEKQCPVCSKIFETQQGHKKEKVTCSYSCSNTYFRSGENNPNYVEVKTNYRDICFANKEAKCCICGFDKSVDVHHFDENKTNNDPSNLVVLCPNHHRLIHMNDYKKETQELVLKSGGV